MKKKILSSIAIIVGCLFFISCNQDPIDKKNSIFDTDPVERTDFDWWLLENYTNVYNVEFKYKFEEIESNTAYNLVPAKLGKSTLMAQIIKYVWMGAYDELLGVGFLKEYSPRILFLIGSAGYPLNSSGERVLGTAEGGIKVTLYEINELEDVLTPEYMKKLTSNYFHTMHHEFAHILHQTTNYSPAFEKISSSEYIGGDWIDHSYDTTYFTSRGFASAYSMMEADEDFVELYAFYITKTKEEWEYLINYGGEAGRRIFDEKIEILRSYFKTSWKIDLDSLRKIVLERNNNIVTKEFITFDHQTKEANPYAGK